MSFLGPSIKSVHLSAYRPRSHPELGSALDIISYILGFICDFKKVSIFSRDDARFCCPEKMALDTGDFQSTIQNRQKRTKEISSCTPEILLKTAILCAE